MSLNQQQFWVAIVLVAVAFIWVFEFFSRYTASPRRSRRLARQITQLVLNALIMSAIVLFFFVAADGRVPAFLRAARGISPIAWAQDTLASSASGALLVVALLVVLSVVGFGAQYLALRRRNRELERRPLEQAYAATGRAGRVVDAISTVVTAPIGEELIFRAYFAAALWALLHSVALALLICWVIFSFLHMRQGPWAVLNGAIIGIPLAVVFLVTQQLWWSIGLHAAANLVAGLILPELRVIRQRRRVRDAVLASVARETTATIA